jgi:hypothetical protein
VSGVYLVLAALGTWVAIRDDLGGRPFGLELPVGPLTGFGVGLGTALSAPLLLLLTLIAANLLLSRGGRVGRRAANVIVVLCLCFFLGMLAEPITWDLLRSGSVGLHGAIVIANLTLPLAMLVLAMRVRPE